MSRENVKIVRRAWESFNRGDRDRVLESFDDDVVVRPADGWPEPTFHGKDSLRRFLDDYAEAVGVETLVEELVDAGNVVVARLRAHLSGHRSGIEGDQRYSQVTTLRKGRVVLMEFFWDHEEALEAAGLRE